MTPCIFIDAYQYFRGIGCLCFQTKILGYILTSVHGVITLKITVYIFTAMETSNFMFFVAFVVEAEGDSEPEDARPSSFRKAGSESSAIESKIIKVSSGIFVYGSSECHLLSVQ